MTITELFSGKAERSNLPRPWWPLWLHRQALLFLPLPVYLRTLHDAYQNKHLFVHSLLLKAGTAHLMVMRGMATQTFLHAMMSFAEGSGSLAGIEGLYLSAMASVQSRATRTLYKQAARTWARVAANTKTYENVLLPIWDRETSTLTFLPDRFTPVLHRHLLECGFDAVTIGAAIRNVGVDIDSIFGGALEPSFQQAASDCKDIVSGIFKFGVAVLGGTVGVGIGAALGHSGDTLALDFGAGGGIGFSVGDGLSNLVAGAICDKLGNKDGGDPSKPGPTVGYTPAGFPIQGNGKEAQPPADDGKTLDDVLGPPDPPMTQDDIDDLLGSVPTSGGELPNPEGGGPTGPAVSPGVLPNPDGGGPIGPSVHPVELPNPEGGGAGGPAVFPKVGGILLETAIPGISGTTLNALVENLSASHPVNSAQAGIAQGSSLTFVIHNSSGRLISPYRNG